MLVHSLETRVNDGNSDACSVDASCSKHLSLHSEKLRTEQPCRIGSSGRRVRFRMRIGKGDLRLYGCDRGHKGQPANFVNLVGADCQCVKPARFAYHLLREMGNGSHVRFFKRIFGAVEQRNFQLFASLDGLLIEKSIRIELRFLSLLIGEKYPIDLLCGGYPRPDE